MNFYIPLEIAASLRQAVHTLNCRCSVPRVAGSTRIENTPQREYNMQTICALLYYTFQPTRVEAVPSLRIKRIINTGSFILLGLTVRISTT